jgi:YebC/PmpR family DNA-binding regulatory protein
MGRAFEFRKERKMKRWSAMAKTFTKIGREIAMAVKEGGASPDSNSRLRLAIANSRSANMPKANVEAAIKRAVSKDAENYAEVIYEGYAPNGVAVLVETTTDNTTRTVSNLRMYFDRCQGALGNSGSVAFMFNRKGIFKTKAAGLDLDSLELELIDFGLEEIKMEEDEAVFICDFSDFGTLAKALEEKGIETTSIERAFIPTMTKKLNDSEVDAVIKLIDRLEEDDDVQNVFTTMDMSE